MPSSALKIALPYGPGEHLDEINWNIDLCACGHWQLLPKYKEFLKKGVKRP
jgi:hypothetical protein